MPFFRVNITRAQGSPIWDRAASRAAGQRMITEVNDLVAQEGVKRTVARLKTVIRDPTPYYWTRITVDRGVQSRTISDSRVVYGGWLEGVDRRNRTSRFKGYRTFRLIKQQLNVDKAKIAKPAIAKFVKIMNR